MNENRKENGRTLVSEENDSVLSAADSNGIPSKTPHFWKNISKFFIALSPNSVTYHF